MYAVINTEDDGDSLGIFESFSEAKSFIRDEGIVGGKVVNLDTDSISRPTDSRLFDTDPEDDEYEVDVDNRAYAIQYAHACGYTD